MDFVRKHIFPLLLFVSLSVNWCLYNSVKFYEDGVVKALYLMGDKNIKEIEPKEAMATLLEHIYNNWLNDSENF